MQTITPLVKILSNLTKRQVVMIKDEYIFLDTKDSAKEEDIVRAKEIQAKEMLDNAITHFTETTSQFIHKKISDYNTDNKIALSSIHSCESYSRVEDYPHKDFCLKVWLWSVKIWVAVRDYQNSMSEIPSDEEFQKVLDSVIF